MADESKSFWTTVPGLLTAIAALLTASTGAYLAFHRGGPDHLVDSTSVPSRSTVSGVWTFTMVSQVAGRTYNGTLRLTQDASIVTGEIDLPGGGNRAVNGTFDGETLELSRDVPSYSTVQRYVLTMKDGAFQGRFWNIGTQADSGSIALSH